MEKIIFLFILVFGHILTMFTTIGEQITGNITVSRCKGDIMVLMCSSGYTITVLEALYGYTLSKTNNCSKGSIPECNRNLPTAIQLLCDNRVDCSFLTEARYESNGSSCPSNWTNNLIITYICSSPVAAATTTITMPLSSLPHIKFTSTYLSSSSMSTTSITTMPVSATQGITAMTLPESTPYTSAWETTDTAGTLATDKTNINATVFSSIKYVTTTESEHLSAHASTENKLNPTSKITKDENSGARAIIGGAVGGSLFLVVLIFITVIFICRQRMSHCQILSTTKSSNIELLSGRDPSKVGTGEGELNLYVIEMENSLCYAEASEHSCHQNTAVDLIAGSSTQFSEDDNGTTTHHYIEIDNPKSHNQYDEIDSAMLQENTDKKEQRRHNQYEDIDMEDQDDHNPCESENKLNPILLKQNNNKIDQQCCNQYEDINMEDQENYNNPCTSNSKKESHDPLYFELELEGNHYSVIDIENEIQVETPDRDLTTHYQASHDDEGQKTNSPIDLNMLYAKSTKHRRSNAAFSKNAETAGSAEDIVMIENVIYSMEEE